MCKGLVLWPELSHGDPFAIEYVAHNAWDAETLSVSEQVDRYCRDRYPAALIADMQEIWREFMPIVQLSAWSIDPSSYYQTANDIFPNIFRNAKFDPEKLGLYREKCADAARLRDAAVCVLRRLAKIPVDDAMTRRDLYDIARTVIGRYLNALISLVQERYLTKQPYETIERPMQEAEALLETLSDLLGSHDDFSLLASLEHLRSVTETNPHFECVLKDNASNHYCRSYIYENVEYLYRPEMRLLFDEVKSSLREDRPLDKERVTPEATAIRDRYFEIPLADMKKDAVPYSDAVRRAADQIAACAVKEER